MSGPKVEVLLEKCYSTVGEGPHWDVASQSLYTVDILAGGVHRWDQRTNKEEKIKLDGDVGFVIPREKGGLVVGYKCTISSLDFNSKQLQTLREVDQGTKNRFNDAKCDPAGRLWAGTMGPESSPGVVEAGAGSLYCIDTDLKISKQQSEVSISNGMDWTTDNTVMYYIDSVPRKVFAYDYDHINGTISNQRDAMDFDTCGIPGLPDGMCIDTNDNIWVAIFGGSKVVQFDPAAGKVVSSIDFPATNITSCCFGGPQLDELFVTCSDFKLPVGTNQPLAGSLFKVVGHGAKGKSPNNFCG